ncbi:DoxX family protein [Comamonas sp. GB3 AK4-5]|uniref:DoxX family protein n=1 Tax=Comamonas sp. GB3 AK4-5 TaxID=3231487 RepID=UPI00351F6E4A
MHVLITQLLHSRLLYVLATALLTYVFWWSGVNKALDFPSAVQEMAHFGLRPAAGFAAATIALQLVAPLAIMACSRWTWLAAGALTAFTLATIPIAHRFWDMQGLEAALEKALVQDHASIIGGLVVAAILAHQRRQALASG